MTKRIFCAARTITPAPSPRAIISLLGGICYAALLVPTIGLADSGDSVEVTVLPAGELVAPVAQARANANPGETNKRLQASVQTAGDISIPLLSADLLRLSAMTFNQAYSLAVEHTPYPQDLRPVGFDRSSESTHPPAALPEGPQGDWVKQWYLPLPALGSPHGVYNSSEAKSQADEIFRLMNDARASKGAQALTRDPHLDAVAQAHAVHMATVNFFDHPNPQGMEVFGRIDAAGGPEWSSAGENIAGGQRDAKEAHDTWMRSKGHRLNILNEQYESTGIGAVYIPGSEYGWYWVQVFATFEPSSGATTWIEPAGAPAMKAIHQQTAAAPGFQRVEQSQRPAPRQRSFEDDEGDNAPCMSGG